MSTHYTQEHEYARLEGGVVTVGISDYAQEQLGDVVFVDLPDVGRTFARGDEAAVVESVKAASEVYAPVSGEVVEVNGGLDGDPAGVNRDAQGAGWFFRLKASDLSELESLMNEDAYRAYAAGLE